MLLCSNEKRTLALYLKVFGAIKELLCENLKLKYVVSDFEAAISSGIRDVFGNITMGFVYSILVR